MLKCLWCSSSCHAGCVCEIPYSVPGWMGALLRVWASQRVIKSHKESDTTEWLGTHSVPGQDAMEARHRFSCFWIPTLREGLWLTPQTAPFLGWNLKWAKGAGIRTQSNSFCIQHFWANVTRTASPWKLSSPSLGCRWDIEEKRDPLGTHSMKSYHLEINWMLIPSTFSSW